MPLLHRVAVLNVLLVLVTVGVTVAVLSPTQVSSFALDEEIAVLLTAVAAVVVTNVLVLRRLVGPVPGDRLPRCRFPGFYSARIDSEGENEGLGYAQRTRPEIA